MPQSNFVSASSSAPVPHSAIRLSDFRNSVGINLHLDFNAAVGMSNNAYTNFQTVRTALEYLGIKNARQTFYGDFYMPEVEQLGSDGIRFDALIDLGAGKDLPTQQRLITAHASIVESVEGLNEIDTFPLSYSGQTGYAGALAAQQAIYAWVHGNVALNNASRTTPVYNLSLGDRANTLNVGNLAPYADYYNSHIYPESGDPPSSALAADLETDSAAVPGKGGVITEGGYSTQPNAISPDETTVAKYDLEFLLDAYKAGVSKTYLFELMDEYADPSGATWLDHYGLFNTDGTPKVAATAVHNFMSLLGDTGGTQQTFTTGSLSYSLSGMPAGGNNPDDGSWVSGGNDFLMQRSDGTFVLALWNEQKVWHWDWRDPSNYYAISAPPVTVTLHLSQAYPSIEVFDPMITSTTPTTTFSNAQDLTLSLPDHPILIMIHPETNLGQTPQPAVAPAPPVSSGSVTLTTVHNVVAGGALPLTVTDNVGGNTITGGSGAFKVVASAGNDVIRTGTSTSNSVLLGGTGADTVYSYGSATVTGNAGQLTLTGNGDLSINGGAGSITLTGGSGSVYVFTQGGTTNLLTLGTGKASVLSHGADTINAGPGAANIYAGGPALINGGSGTVGVNGQSQAVTVNGGTGAVHATAGRGGGYMKGGSNGGNALIASAGNATLAGGGNGDTLTDTGTTGGNTLIAGVGAETLTGGTAGSDLFVLTQSNLAHGEVIRGFTSGTDHLHFVGFGSTQPIVSQEVVGGNLQLTLADHAHVTLIGITSLGGAVT